MYYKENELVLIYNANSSRDKKALALAQSISRKINKQDLTSCKVSPTLFQLALNKLHLHGKDVINKSNPYYQEKFRGKNLTDEEWIQIVMRMPELLKAPIAMFHGKAVLCQSETEILKLAD